MIRVWSQPVVPLFDAEPSYGDILIWFNTNDQRDYIFSVSEGIWKVWYPDQVIKDLIG